MRTSEPRSHAILFNYLELDEHLIGQKAIWKYSFYTVRDMEVIKQLKIYLTCFCIFISESWLKGNIAISIIILFICNKMIQKYLDMAIYENGLFLVITTATWLWASHDQMYLRIFSSNLIFYFLYWSCSHT